MFSRACRTSGSLLLLAAVVSGGNASQPCEGVHDSWVRCVGTTCKPYLSNTALYKVCSTGCTDVLKENCALNDSCSISGNTCTTFNGCKLCSQCTTQTTCSALSGCLWTGRVCTFEKDIRPQCTADRAIKEAQSRCNSRKFCSWNVDSSFCIMECKTLSKKTCDAYDTCTYNTATNECDEKPHVVDCTTRHSEHDCAAQHTCVWSPTTKHCMHQNTSRVLPHHIPTGSAQVSNPPDSCSGFVVEADCDDHNECLWSLGSCMPNNPTPKDASPHRLYRQADQEHTDARRRTQHPITPRGRLQRWPRRGCLHRHLGVQVGRTRVCRRPPRGRSLERLAPSAWTRDGGARGLRHPR